MKRLRKNERNKRRKLQDPEFCELRNEKVGFKLEKVVVLFFCFNVPMLKVGILVPRRK